MWISHLFRWECWQSNSRTNHPAALLPKSSFGLQIPSISRWMLIIHRSVWKQAVVFAQLVLRYKSSTSSCPPASMFKEMYDWQEKLNCSLLIVKKKNTPRKVQETLMATPRESIQLFPTVSDYCGDFFSPADSFLSMNVLVRQWGLPIPFHVHGFCRSKSLIHIICK